jgi:hypothetical protein
MPSTTTRAPGPKHEHERPQRLDLPPIRNRHLHLFDGLGSAHRNARPLDRFTPAPLAAMLER